MNKVSREEIKLNLHITDTQARELDKLDGNKEDGITLDIYTMAKMALAKKDGDNESVAFYQKELTNRGANMGIFSQVENIINGKAQQEFPPPQYFDKNGNDSTFHYIKYDRLI